MHTHTTHAHTIQCDPSEATWQLIKSIVLEDAGRNISKIMFLGGGCSLASEPLAALAGIFYKIPMVSLYTSCDGLHIQDTCIQVLYARRMNIHI